MNFPTYISVPFAQGDPLPEHYGFQDVRFSRELATYIIERYSSPGDTVLDPFAGFGTTLVAAQELGRKGLGIEIDGDKVDYMATYLGLGEDVIRGDINRLFLDKVLPEIDLVFTSPPYMGREDQADALTGYRFAGTYDLYLDKMTNIFGNIAERMCREGIVVVEISNLKQERSLTTLAWDVGKRLGEVLDFCGEIIVNWTGERREDGIYNYGYDHSYCLVYSSS